MTRPVLQSKDITHIPGTFLIDAPGSFLNGSGISKGKEYKNYTKVKTFRDGVSKDGRTYFVPYVSAQALRRYWRDTVNREAGWQASQIRALKLNVKEHTSKIGGEFNPVEFPEDDLFGYMRTVKEETENEVAVEDDEKKIFKVKNLKRTSPLSTSILMSLRKDGWEGIDEAWVHLIEGSANPYTTQFYSTTLQGIFTLNYANVCRFSNVGDSIELREDLVDRFLKENKIREVGQHEYYGVKAEIVPLPGKDKKTGKPKTKTNFKKDTKYGKIYEMVNADSERQLRASKLLKSLARLEGGAKQSAFATDISPKVLLVAGLHNCANPIFNDLFEDDRSSSDRNITVKLKVDTLLEVVNDYVDRLCTHVYVGIRTGYLQNEYEIKKQLAEQERFVVTTPILAAQMMAQSLGST